MANDSDLSARYRHLQPAERLAELADDPALARPELALALAGEARRALVASRAEGRSLAHLAVLAVRAALDRAVERGQRATTPLLHDTAAEAWAIIAETDALDQAHESAWAALATSRMLLAHGSGDALLAAHVTAAEALICWSADNHERSLFLLDLAEALYLELADPRGGALVEVRRAAVLNDLGKRAEALAALHRARSLDPQAAASAMEPLLDDLLSDPPSSHDHSPPH